MAALRVAREFGPDGVVIVLAPDSGRAYLSKYFDDDWLRRAGFPAPAGPGPHVRDGRVVTPIVVPSGARVRDLALLTGVVIPRAALTQVWPAGPRTFRLRAASVGREREMTKEFSA